jgi:hypothetical protein
MATNYLPKSQRCAHEEGGAETQPLIVDHVMHPLFALLVLHINSSSLGIGLNLQGFE